jgi:hypothetical protein
MTSTSRSASQLAAEARVAEAQLLDAHAVNSTARSRLPRLLQSGDQPKIQACKDQIASSGALIAELTETADAFRAAIKAAEAGEIEDANHRGFESIHKHVVAAAEATKALDSLIVQFGAAITEWNAAVSTANNALQNNGISPLRDLLSITTMVNLMQMNLYVHTDGVMGKAVTLDNLHQLRENIAKGGNASLHAAAETYKTLTLRHARIYLNLSRPEAA